MTELGLIGPVEIRVPPDPSLSRVLRLAASGMASLAGFTIDEIEDIKIAVSEVLLALIEHGSGNPVEVQFESDDHSFKLRGRSFADNFDIEHPDLVLCRSVLAGVCDSHTIDHVDNQAHIWAEVTHKTIE
ncbi:MAG: ATP-binding protein [Ilumatobacteraceae bacterium]